MILLNKMKKRFMIREMLIIIGVIQIVDLSSGWPINLGCFLDNWDRVLPILIGHDITNLTACIGFCRIKGTRFAGVEIGHHCFCGNDWPKYGHTSPCGLTCVGGEPCGGLTWAINVYTVCPNATYWDPVKSVCTQCGSCLDPVCHQGSGNCTDRKCYNSWGGSKCDQEITCPDGQYGVDCKTCGQCAVGHCNRTTGECDKGCKDGYQKPLCQECTNGRYGSSCTEYCGECLNDAPCDKETGECPNGECKQGFKGSICKECTDYKYGSNCDQDCGNCSNGESCDKVNGECPSGKCTHEGWKGPMCNECVDGRFGLTCRNTCGDCLNNVPCDKETGQCPNGECKQGYKVPLCKGCADYKYGPYCNETCGKCINNEPCNKWTGECKDGKCLHDGWKGPMCQECIDGISGASCNGNCGFCLNGEPCDQSTGECPGGECQDGYKGPICKACVDGKYGSSCREKCGQCLNDATCDKETGQCPNGTCQPGYKGPMCNMPCEDGKYGLDCGSCGYCLNNVPCDKETGQCPNGECAEGYKGPMCQACSQGTHCDFKCNCESHEVCDPVTKECKDERSTGTATNSPKDQGQQKGGSLMPIIGGAVGALFVIAMIIIVVIIVLRCRKQTQKEKQNDFEAPSSKNETGAIYTMTGAQKSNIEPKKSGRLPEPPKDSQTTPELPSDGNIDQIYENKDLSKAIKVEDIENYVKVMKETKDGFLNEFKTIPSGKIAVYTIGADRALKSKNRFKEIYPYDHSRVHLTKIPGVEGSDYINACHINGYKAPRKFIATQGPKDNTVEDFWRMVWEQKVSRIVMVANIYEDTKKKCEKYWPDYLKSETFGTFVITTKKEELYKGFIVRTMKIASNEKSKKDKNHIYSNTAGGERTVIQFHFTDWPDKGVPLYCTALVSFHRKIISMSEKVKTPIVVHCSAGIGRTGTYIALDYLTDQCHEEGVIDVFQCVNGLRKDRINMVQTEEQYVFLYETLYESLTTGVTLIPCFKFTEIHQQLQQIEPEKNITGLEAQYKILMGHKQKVIQERKVEEGLKAENCNKNRSREIVPGDNVRVHVLSEDQKTHQYVNAVFAENYSRRSGVILTQLPLEETVEDFWRMVERYYVNTIISLSNHQDETFQTSKFWPAGTEEEVVVGPFAIQRRDMSPQGTVNSCHLVLTYKDEERNVFLVGATNWSDDEWKPSNVNTMYDLYSNVQTWQKGHSSGGQTLIQCFDGGMKSGMYAVVSWMFDMINSEQEVDIFQITKQILLSRPEFMQNMDQYKDLYSIAEEYMANFQNYSNFK